MTAGAAGPTVGIDLGGTNLRIGVVDDAGTIVDEHRVGAPKELDALVTAIRDGIAAVRGAAPIAVGIGAAGMIDAEGVVHYAPNLPMFLDVPLRALVQADLDLPVVVDNDANVAAWGEACHGALRGHPHGLLVTLGTGVGGGIIADGRLLRGAHGFAAEIGHWQIDPTGPRCACGELGHWEAEASGTALGRLGRQRAGAGEAPNVLAHAGGDPDAVTGVHVGDSAQAGEPDGTAIIDEFAQVVAIGMAGLTNILDPAIIVVSGGLVELGDTLLDPVRAAFAGHLEGSAYRPQVPIVAGELGDAAGVVGAAALARELVAPRVKVGLALPSFVEDPEIPLGVARAAEAAGLDGVFVYDHLFRLERGVRRPALEGVALLGAVAAATSEIAVGALVFRAWLRPAASLAAAIATVARIAPGRVIATIGAGDSQSREENESFGLGFGTMQDRVDALRATAEARDVGARIWVGGRAKPVRRVAAEEAQGWNAWGGDVDHFASQVADTRAMGARPGFECTWGGLVVLAEDDERARAKAERLDASDRVIVGGPATVAAGLARYATAGADWVIAAPLDSRDPENARLLGERVKPLLGP